MPYRSKAERERARWMTLNEALVVICRVDQCKREDAWSQLRQALADEAIEWKWADPLPSSIRTSARPRANGPNTKNWRLPRIGNKVVVGRVRSKSAFWKSVRADFKGDGSICDQGIYDDRKYSENPYRRIFLLRELINVVWPPNKKNVEDKDRGLLIAAARKPQASKSSIKRACQDVYRKAQEQNAKPPNKEEAWKLVHAQLPAARKLLVREILDMPEFSKQRIPMGKSWKALIKSR